MACLCVATLISATAAEQAPAKTSEGLKRKLETTTTSPLLRSASQAHRSAVQLRILRQKSIVPSKSFQPTPGKKPGSTQVRTSKNVAPLWKTR